jgi:hypothetical protein
VSATGLSLCGGNTSSSFDTALTPPPPRRYAIETARAREKTKFLVGRVLPTVTMIKTFGAWKRYYLNEVSYNKPANEFYKQKLRMKLQQRLHWWTYWMRRRKGLRRGWIEKGYVMVRYYTHTHHPLPSLLPSFPDHRQRCVKIEDCIRLPFQVWRASVVFKVCCFLHLPSSILVLTAIARRFD